MWISFIRGLSHVAQLFEQLQVLEKISQDGAQNAELIDTIASGQNRGNIKAEL